MRSLFKKHIFILLLITLVGGVFRTYQLDQIPAGFFCDEASVGFNAYQIAKFGTDEYGTAYPFFFRAFGEYKSPVQIYSTVPFIWLLGLSEFSVRLVSALWGTAAIIALYFLTKELFKNQPHKEKIALLSSIFLAISPWHIHLSRVSLEGLAPMVFFTVLATTYFLKAQRDIHFLFISILLFALAFYSYFPARLFIPALTVTVTLLYFNSLLKYKKKLILAVLLLMILLLPFFSSITSQDGLARWQQVSIFSHPPQDSTIPQHILNNYLSHFSLDFLFFKGDSGMLGQFITRHSLKNFGELYLLQAIFIVLGFIFLWRDKDKKTLLLILAWLILYPLGSIFTTDKSAQATRSIAGVIPWQILTGMGIVYLFYLLKSQILRITLLVILTVSLCLSVFIYVQEYFIKYPLYSSDYWGWQSGPKEVMQYYLAQANKYDDLYLSGEFNGSHIFPKFYDPQNKCLFKCRIGDFWRQPEIYNSDRKQLFALSPEYLRNSLFAQQFSIHQIIYYPNGKAAFVIGEVTKKKIYATLPQI